MQRLRAGKVCRDAARRRVAFIDFWQSLDKREKASMVNLTEEVPLCPGVGLCNIVEELWDAKPFLKIWYTMNCLRMVLAGINVTSIFLKHWYQLDFLKALGLGHGGTYVFLRKDHHIRLCDIREGNALKSSCMDVSPSRWACMGIFVTAEFVCTATLLIAVIIPAAMFLCRIGLKRSRCGWFRLVRLSRSEGGSREMKPGEEQEIELPVAYPYLFFFVPGFAYKFSTLSGLQFVNYRRAESLFVRLEGAMWHELIFRPNAAPQPSVPESTVVNDQESPLVPKDETASRPVDELVYSKIKRVSLLSQPEMWLCSRRLLAMAFSGLCVVLSVQALLVKLTMLHFATIHSFYHWTWHEWVLFAGLVNAIAGAFDPDLIEMHRLLLLKFGGEDAWWQPEEIASVRDYFHILSKRIVADFCAPDSFTARCTILNVMSMWGSQDLQRQMLDDTRSVWLANSRRRRLQLHDTLFGSRGAKEFADAMRSARAARSADARTYSLQEQLDHAEKQVSEWESARGNLAEEAKWSVDGTTAWELLSELDFHMEGLRTVHKELQDKKQAEGQQDLKDKEQR